MANPTVILTEDQLEDVTRRADIGFPYAISKPTILALVGMARAWREENPSKIPKTAAKANGR
jgi:hypothetical protein